MNPLVRSGPDRKTWGRYDVDGGRTIYAGDPDEASYAESLAAQRVANSVANTTMGELFSSVSGRGGLPTLLEIVEQEWAERHHMAPRQVAAAWRNERLLYRLDLPSDGWFVDIEMADSIAAVSRALPELIVGSGRDQLTTGYLKSEDRDLTTAIAEWVRGIVLDDGNLPHGIVYESKHSKGWRCWAIWLRALDDGKDLTSEPTRASSGEEIDPANKNECLERVAKLFNLRVN